MARSVIQALLEQQQCRVAIIDSRNTLNPAFTTASGNKMIEILIKQSEVCRLKAS